MDQETHTWIAIRAIALLEDEGSEKGLINLLKPFTCLSSIGAWLPDESDAQRGGATATKNNHIFKISPLTDKEKIKTQKERFVLNKEDLLKKIGKERAISKYLQDDKVLDSNWWEQPYRANPKNSGKHIPNRAMALSIMLKDIILFGNDTVQDFLPGKPINTLACISDSCRTEDEAIAMYFFMLSHFCADATMPCHCDDREIAAYENGLHNGLENYWSKEIGIFFNKKNILPNITKPIDLKKCEDALNEARNVDSKFNIQFSNKIPNLIKGNDVWLEVVYLCRASFALNNIIADASIYPYESKKKSSPTKISFKKYFAGKDKLLADVSRVTLHDAVLNTAMIWKNTWKSVSK